MKKFLSIKYLLFYLLPMLTACGLRDWIEKKKAEQAEADRYKATCVEYVDWRLEYDWVVDYVKVSKCFKCEDGAIRCE